MSRWETGETTPNTETLKLLSELFDVSIDTLLGSNRTRVCQCCGMPLDDESIISHDKNGELNEHYCKWCYADGTFTYGNMNDLIDVCVKHMTDQGFTEEQARKHMENLLPTLDYWKITNGSATTESSSNSSKSLSTKSTLFTSKVCRM